MGADDNAAVGSSFFQRGTAVDRRAPGRYEADLSPEWNCPIVPQGGIVAATAARALHAEIADETQSLRSITTVFAGRVHAGPVEITVDVLRRGRSMSQAIATMRNPGEAAGLTAVAVFGAPREGFTFTDAEPPPGIMPPDECPSFRSPLPPDAIAAGFEPREPFAFWNHIEGKPILGHAPWEHYDPESSLTARWSRFDDPPRGDDGTWDPFALIVLSDTMPSAVGERVGPSAQERQWLPPSADLTVHILDDARCDWLLGVNRARHASGGYASADMELWDMEGREPRLVAYATQVMVFAFPEG